MGAGTMSILGRSEGMDKEYIDNLKREYNKTILRHWKAAVYLEDHEVPIPEREKWLPEYRKILDQLQTLLNQFDLYGVKYTVDEALGGFNMEEAA
jgi:hypothetical protein